MDLVLWKTSWPETFCFIIPETNKEREERKEPRNQVILNLCQPVVFQYSTGLFIGFTENAALLLRCHPNHVWLACYNELHAGRLLQTVSLRENDHLQSCATFMQSSPLLNALSCPSPFSCPERLKRLKRKDMDVQVMCNLFVFLVLRLSKCLSRCSVLSLYFQYCVLCIVLGKWG